MQGGKAEADTPTISMDMLRRILEESERNQRKTIGVDELFLERPIPPLSDPPKDLKALIKPLAQAKKESDPRDRFDLGDEDFLKEPKKMVEF